MATEAVFKYLAATNRPYSANDITLNLHNEFGKNAVQKALDDLSANGRIKEKTYGKQKIYCVIQEASDQSLQDEVPSLEEMLKEKESLVKKLEEEAQKLRAQLKGMSGEMTLDEAKNEASLLEQEKLDCSTRLSALQAGTAVLVSAEEQQKQKALHAAATKALRVARNPARDILNSILEQYPKSKAQLYEEIGIELDP